jgi:multidrug efflux pump subunit AcrB
MWIVNLALRRPYTFIVLAVLLFIIGPLAVQRTPTDIFPNIDIPVVSIVWTYNGFSAEDMAHRITSNYKRALTSDVDDIEHIESQSLNGVSVVKVFFHRRIQPVDATLPLLTQPLERVRHFEELALRERA